MGYIMSVDRYIRIVAAPSRPTTV